jgi:S-formylglutathione hydrolase FrmB
MGGYGAVKLALKHPQLFVSAHSHSGALLFGHADPAHRPDHAAEFERILGPHPAGGSNDCFALASKAVQLERQARPALRIDCGTADALLGASRQLHDHLQTVGYEHEYQEFGGGHDWGYWDRHVQEAINFHAACCKIT